MNTNLALNHVTLQTCPKGSGAAKQPHIFYFFFHFIIIFFYFLLHKVNLHVCRRADFLLLRLVFTGHATRGDVEDIQEKLAVRGGGGG